MSLASFHSIVSALALLFCIFTIVVVGLDTGEESAISSIIDNVNGLPSEWQKAQVSNACNWQEITCDISDHISDLYKNQKKKKSPSLNLLLFFSETCRVSVVCQDLLDRNL